LFQEIEDRLVLEGKGPLSLDPKREAIEREFLVAWASGQNPMIENIRDALE
jgi:hypothetical protein